MHTPSPTPPAHLFSSKILLVVVQDHDVVFWFGDLNYRIESSVAALEVLGHAVSGGLPFLATKDQLNSAREAGAAFEGFHEGAAWVGGGHACVLTQGSWVGGVELGVRYLVVLLALVVLLGTMATIDAAWSANTEQVCGG